MATSSLTHNFVLHDPEAVERFIAALDATEPFRTPIREPRIHELTDQKEIFELAKRIIANHKALKS